MFGRDTWNEIEKSGISDEEKEILKKFLAFINENKYQLERLKVLTHDELCRVFKIAEFNPKLQIEIWRILPYEVVNNPENSEIFEAVLQNKFGEYIKRINKRELVELLNNSRSITYAIGENSTVLFQIEAMLEQMNSSIFENEIAREAFSFEQLLEIVSVKETEEELERILCNPNSREILRDIGRDTQSWQAKLQYLMNLSIDKREIMINEFALDKESLIQKELRRREEHFRDMEIGYSEDEEYGILDIDFNPHAMLNATFGILYEEAKELIKKYGVDIDKLHIETDDDKKIYRKLQIIKELTTTRRFENYEDEIEYYREFYYSHKDELVEISKDVSIFYQVDMEKSFLDLYARQYDRSLGVQADRMDDISYNGNNIPVYEVSGDFILLIRGEQNVSPDNQKNFWNNTWIHIKGLCQNTISQDYIRTVNYEGDDICFIASTSCKDGELRMASTTNIKSKEANIALSNLGISSKWGNGVCLRIPREQINNSRGTNNETDTSRRIYNSETGLYERKSSDYVVYIQDTNDTNIEEDPRFKTAQFVASETGWPILIIPREKCAQREKEKIEELKEKLLGNKERAQGENDENLIRELIVKFNNNREGILTSKGLKGKYFTESEHIELVGTINARLSQLKAANQEEYERLVQVVSGIYKDEIAKYYAFSYDRDDAQKELDIDSTREHLKPYEDFLLEHERNMFDLSEDERTKIYDVIRNISNTSYYDMNMHHSLSHIQKVIMFSGILAKNENLNDEETIILLAAAAFHDSGRAGKEGEDDNHAIASAREVNEYLKNNPDNPFGITQENISMIQAVIEYHEYKEQEKGVTDIEKIKDLLYEYNVDYEKLEFLIKVSELLKDADALDRARFGKKNENKWSLDAGYLKSDTAKSVSMLRFSEQCNLRFREIENQGDKENTVTSSQNIVQEIFESELNEFNRAKIQMSSLKQMTSGITADQKRKTVDSLGNIIGESEKSGQDVREDFKK